MIPGTTPSLRKRVTAQVEPGPTLTPTLPPKMAPPRVEPAPSPAPVEPPPPSKYAFDGQVVLTREVGAGFGGRDIYITYPPAGGTKSVGIGDLVIDFVQGRVRLPDGSRERTSGNLIDTGWEDIGIQSATIHASQIVLADIDRLGFWTVNANEITTFLRQPCRFLTIRTTQATNIRVYGSTNAIGGPAISSVTAPAPGPS